MHLPMSSEPTCGSIPFDEEESGCAPGGRYWRMGAERDDFGSPFLLHSGDCPMCGVTFGFGSCHVCLAIAVEAFQNEDKLDGL